MLPAGTTTSNPMTALPKLGVPPNYEFYVATHTEIHMHAVTAETATSHGSYSHI